MTQQSVDALRKDLDNVKVRGKDIPKPITTWTQGGFK